MAHLFRRLVSQAAEEGRPRLDPLRNTVAVAERCAFRLQDLRYAFPRPRIPSGESAYSCLVRLVELGKAIFYPQTSPQVVARIEHELAIVRDLDLAGYLLVFKEVVDWSQEQGITCSIRGSAPASALLYCLGLCPIDPVEHNLLFERFCSPERKEYPDIDLDFPHERREEVIQHVYQKYGRDRAAMVCEVNTYRIKSALRDVAKVLGLSPQRAQQLADQVDWHDPDPRDRIVREDGPAPPPPRAGGRLRRPGPRAGGPGARARRRGAGGGDEHEGRIGGPLAELLLDLARQLLHSPRHHSIHVGGMVVSDESLLEVASIEPARMPGRTILPWDKDDLTLLAEEFGINLIKMDFLGLGMLSLVGRCFQHVRERTGERLRLHGFRYDPRAFDVLGRADTVGLFQVESRAQQSFLPRLRPRNLAEVAISVGAIRPGPGAARAGEHIVRRRQRREPVSYPAPELEPALRETYGVLLWQEQCIQVAVTAAGYTPGEGDQLRRAMSHKRSYERLEALTAELIARMTERGYSPRVAEAVRHMIVGFAGYGFPRSHAYAFAHLALISATLRLRYPAAYYAALLNCQPMGFYAPHTVLWDAHRHGIPVLPVDVNRSRWECTLEETAPGGATPPHALRAGGLASGEEHQGEEQGGTRGRSRGWPSASGSRKSRGWGAPPGRRWSGSRPGAPSAPCTTSSPAPASTARPWSVWPRWGPSSPSPGACSPPASPQPAALQAPGGRVGHRGAGRLRPRPPPRPGPPDRRPHPATPHDRVGGGAGRLPRHRLLHRAPRGVLLPPPPRPPRRPPRGGAA